MGPALLSLLEAAAGADEPLERPAEQIEQDIVQRFQVIWQACSQPHAQHIPSFKPACTGDLRDLVLREARLRKAQAQRQLCLEEAELEVIGQLLLEHQVQDETGNPVLGADGPRINYDGFTQAAARIRAELGSAVSSHFQASSFLRFERDAAGAISLPHFLQFFTLQCAGARLRAQLAEFDDSGRGQLGLPQLHRYLRAVAAAAPVLAGMEPSFLPHYLAITSRKLLLFHGRRSLRPCSTARQQQHHGNSSSSSSSSSSSDLVVRVADLVTSNVMAELQELLLMGPGAEVERDLFSNWFTLQSTQRVLATFTGWDLDGNGSLSKQEFSAIGQGQMTELFISRVFEEHVTPRRGAAWPPQHHHQQQLGSPGTPSPSRPGSLPSIGARGCSGSSPPRAHSPPGRAGGGARAWPLPPGAAGPADEMDLLAFADFVLAWDHRGQAAAVPYFFAIFDIHKRGYLTPADLYTFFREVKALWVAMGEYADLDVYDVIDEVFDMVAPAVPGRITRADLAACRLSGQVFGLLANVNEFYQYNFRESFMHQEGGEGGAAAGGGG